MWWWVYLDDELIATTDPQWVIQITKDLYINTKKTGIKPRTEPITYLGLQLNFDQTTITIQNENWTSKELLCKEKRFHNLRENKHSEERSIFKQTKKTS